MELFRTATYKKGLKRLRKLGATAADIKTMEDAIGANPGIGDVIPGTGGMQKVRFGYAKAGKSGGGRTIYYAMTDDGFVYLLTAYAKVDQDDLSADDKKQFKILVKELTDDQED